MKITIIDSKLKTKYENMRRSNDTFMCAILKILKPLNFQDTFPMKMYPKVLGKIPISPLPKKHFLTLFSSLESLTKELGPNFAHIENHLLPHMASF
jgi:hypothetical protein